MAIPVSWRLREYWNSPKLSQRLKYFYANLRLFFIFLAEAQGGVAMSRRLKPPVIKVNVLSGQKIVSTQIAKM